MEKARPGGGGASKVVLEYLARHHGNAETALRLPGVLEWMSNGGDLPGLIRQIWVDSPVLDAEPTDLRALSHLEEAELRTLAEEAMRHYRQHPRDPLAAAVLSEASYQLPGVLRERVQELAEALLDPKAARFALNPFTLEGVSIGGVGPLLDICDRSDDAFVLLRYTPAAAIVDRAIRLRFSDLPEEEIEHAIWYSLLAAGLDPGDSRRLFPEQGYHLLFAPAEPPVRVRPIRVHPIRVHPIQRLYCEEAPAVSCGGGSDQPCPVCGGSLLHLMTLDPLPADLGVTRMRRLSLQYCVVCISLARIRDWHCEHDESGAVRVAAGAGRRSRRRGTATRLFLQAQKAVAEMNVPMATARLVPIPDRWRTQRSDFNSPRSRVGGPPVREVQYPECPRCEQYMTLLAQLFSNDSTSLCPGADPLSVFWCDACRVSSYDEQT